MNEETFSFFKFTEKKNNQLNKYCCYSSLPTFLQLTLTQLRLTALTFLGPVWLAMDFGLLFVYL